MRCYLLESFVVNEMVAHAPGVPVLVGDHVPQALQHQLDVVLGGGVGEADVAFAVLPEPGAGEQGNPCL